MNETGFEDVEQTSYDCDLLLYNQPLGYTTHKPYPKPCKMKVDNPLEYFDLSDVPEEAKKAVEKLIMDFADSVISFSKEDYSPMNKYVLNLKVKDETPNYINPFPLTPGFEEQMRLITDQMLEKGQLVAMDDCIYTSPCFLVLRNSEEKRNKELERPVEIAEKNVSGIKADHNEKFDEIETKELDKQDEIDKKENMGSNRNSQIVPEAQPKNRQYRLITDFRYVNMNLDTCGYLDQNIRGIQESLDRIGNNQYMSSFDISSFFWSIVVNKESRRYLGLSLPWTPITYCYSVLPYGLSIGPTVSQGLLKKSLRRSVLDKSIIHVDDILVSSESIEEHLARIRELFEDLKEAGLLIHYSKLKLFRKKINFLGYSLEANRYSLLPDRVKIITGLPVPRTRAQLQSFLGLINFCSSFIDSHQLLCSILYPALKQHEKI